MKKITFDRLSKMSKGLKTFLFLSLFSFTASAQTFYTETFDGTACAGTSGCDPSIIAWTTTSIATAPGNGGAANQFYVSCTENGNAAGVCGSGCGSDQSLHLGNVAASSAAFIFCPTGDCGAAYDDSSPAEATHKRAESPTISCLGQSNITIAFNYMEGGEAADDDASLVYFDGTVWTTINALAKTLTCPSGQGRWTAFTATLPASADGNPNVKIGFVWKNDGDGAAADPSFAVDDITLTSSSTNSITTGTISGSPFCACSTINVPFTSTGTFTAGNIYTAQLSNAAGSFAAPTAIGTLASTANTGTISATIPCGTPSGTLYRIRVVSSAPVATGTDNGVNITINAVVVPSVTIAAVPAGAICAGTSVTFTATPTNGGAAPTYQWQINGTNVGGATSSTFTSTTLANGDNVTVIMTSNAPCPTPATATSTAITMTVNPVVVPSVSIVSNPSPATICAGDPVLFTATPTNGGAAPTYQWQINGTNVGGATLSTFTSTTLVNGDAVTVIMTSNATCPSPATATSNTITVTVNPVVAASVSITSSPSPATICAGDPVTFTATPTNGGSTPTYQWQINGTNVGGATSSTFNSSTLVNGDVVTVIMTSNAACVTGSPATSNGITITVSAAVVASVSITSSPSPATICAGDPVTFTATPTNGGSTPTYQWQVNGTNVGGATLSTFTSSTLVNGDVVTVIMTSSSSCATGSPATSNTITITVTPAVAASVSITSSPSPATICAGDPVTFTATPTNGGTTPTYQWQVNGTNVGGATSDTFTSSTLADTDVVTVIMTSSSSCATGSPATSNSITVTVSPSVVASVNITSSPSPAVICLGDPVSFTATPTNGGATPTYQWQVNGTNVGGATADTFTSTTLVNGDVVTVIMTSSSSCATGSPATSNSITITVSGSVVASVNITSVPSPATICAGDPVTFTAIPTNGGTAPTYQWQVNGADVTGATSDTFTSTTLANGDVVTVIMTSNSSCATGSPATSNGITITVNPSVTPSVSIVSTPAMPVCSGEPVTFTATPTNGGTAPTFQWLVNGSNAGTTATFTSSTLNNGDVVTCVLTSNAPCASPTTATSNAIVMNIVSNLTPSVTIAGSTTICVGDPAGYSATPTNGGTTPSYQWQVNGSNVGTNSPTFGSASLNNGDVVTCIMTSSEACASPATATSNSITLTVQNCDEPVANFSGTPTTMCEAGCVSFTDLSTNTPTSWTWSFPGASPSSSTAQNPTNICYSADGSYDVQLIATNSSGSDTLLMPGYITVGIPVQVEITGNLLITSCEETLLTAVPTDGTYTWGPSIAISPTTGATVTVKPPSTQDYYVEYTSPEGCTDGDTVTVVVEDINTWFLPTGFTPNNDGINDEIHLHGRGIDWFTLRIYDRIGEKVFESGDLDKGWDGKLLGLPMNNGVFVYVLDITFCNGENVKDHGDITLVK